MATWFLRRAGWANPPVDIDDLVQIGLVTCWAAIASYEVRCPLCARVADDYPALARHGERRHGAKRLVPRNTLLRYIHRKVGSAMDHELYRHVRRSKFHGELPVISPDFVPRSMRVDPRQESYAEFRLLLARAREKLGPKKHDIFLELLRGDLSTSIEAQAAMRTVRQMARG